MNTDKILALIETVHTGSLNRAAEKLGYSTSGLSYTISSLESELGLELIIRTHNGIRLTKDGQNLLPYFESVIQNEEALQQQISSLRKTAPEAIRIGAYSSWLLQILPDVVEEYSKICPKADFEFRTGVTSLKGMLSRNEIDLAICEHSVVPDMEWVHIADDPVCVAVKTSSPLAQKDSLTLEDLKGYEMVPSVNPDHIVYSAYRDAGLDINPSVAFYSEDGSVMLSIVQQKNCIAFLDHLYAGECPYNIALIPIDPPLIKHLGVAISESGKKRKDVKKFVEFLKGFDYSGY
jgi:DNA-binding transcriptional LysR family regulator